MPCKKRAAFFFFLKGKYYILQMSMSKQIKKKDKKNDAKETWKLYVISAHGMDPILEGIKMLQRTLLHQLIKLEHKYYIR